MMAGRILAMALVALAAPAQADRVDTAVATLERDWGEPGGWRGINAWQRFVIADGLIDRMARTGDRTMLPRLAAVVANRSGLDGNDDDLWAVLAETHLFRLTANPALLATASTTFDAIVAAYWDDRCGGGLWWDHARTYKNAITTALLILAAADLHRVTGRAIYRDWAERGWRWFAASGLIGARGLANDGLDAACRNNGGPTYSYNQGVLVGALLSLGDVAGAATIARAAIARLADRDGILAEPADTLGRDGPMFKGILAFHLGHLTRALPAGADRTAIRRFLARNADAVWRRSGRGARAVTERWAGPGGATGAAAQASGVDLLDAVSDRRPPVVTP